MKNFTYKWDDSVFLLHIQLTRSNAESDAVAARISREYEGGQTKSESVEVKKGDKSHRFIVSRSHPKEISFRVEYPQAVSLEAFKIDDRAYYPTESFFVG